MTKQITMMDIVRAANLAILPPGGGWVCIKGLSHMGARRGHRIIPAHRDIGIRHMDIYWAIHEMLTFNPRPRHLRRRRRLDEYANMIVQRGDTREEALEQVADEYYGLFMNQPYGDPTVQATLITIVHPYHEQVRFYNSEIVVFGRELIRSLLEENYVETIVFGQAQIPILEEAVRDIVDAMQVDGCSFAQAQHEALVAGVLEPDQISAPNWFYRPTGPFRDTFVEEESDDR